MDKKLLRFALVAFAALCIPMFVACSSDSESDENGGGSSAKNAVFKTSTGESVVVSSLANSYGSTYEFEYNEKGQVTRIGDMLFDYKKGEIVDLNRPSDKCSFTTNSRGFITKLSGEEDYDDEPYQYSHDFTYDSEGHLIKWVYTDSEEYNDDGNKVTDTEEIVKEISWNAGLITKVTSTSKCYHGDEKYTHNPKSTYSPSYDKENPLGQFTMNLDKLLFLDEEEEIIIAGLFGKAPTRLISRIHKEYEDDYFEEYGTSSYSYSYNFNSDGTISSETRKSDWGTSTYRYYYSVFETNSGSGSSTGGGIFHSPAKKQQSLVSKFRAKKDSFKRANPERQPETK